MEIALEFAVHGKRLMNFERGVARDLRFHNNGIAQNVAVDPRNDTESAPVKTFRNAQKHAQLFDDFQIFLADDIAVSCPLDGRNILFLVTSRHERRQNDLAVRRAVNARIHDRIARVLRVAVIAQTSSAINKARRDF